MKNFGAFAQTVQVCIGIALLISFMACERHTSVARDEVDDYVVAAAKGKDAVVFIFVVTSDTATYYTDNQTGSGVIISEDGYIVTNYHVLKNASQIHIVLNDRREYHATLVGIDSSHDVALLKIPGQQYPVLKFADSDSIRVGERVLAVGNPYRLQSTVTSGIVSALDREIDLAGNMTRNFIQTDVPINLGNSGGALVNRHGELIGLNLAYLSASGAYEGFSFAIPSNLVRKIATDLREYGVTQKGSLGITIRPVTHDIAAEIGMTEIYGLVVDAVYAGSAADSAGIQSLDILTTIDGTRILSSSQFRGKLDLYRPDDIMKLGVLRGDTTMEIAVRFRRREI
jgi:S1-C subfamily serine protease